MTTPEFDSSPESYLAGWVRLIRPKRNLSWPPLDKLKMVDERQVRLDQIAPNVKARFVYEYDFGDSWEHKLVVEKILPPEAAVKYPRCMDGQRACPPDDVGGVWGYQDFLDAIRDPKHPDHEDMVEWIGGEFDPEAFDLRGVNGALQLFQGYVEGASR